MIALQAINISRYFGGLAAVSNVSFQVNEGEIVGLIGPNGAGKTTLVNLITGMLKPDRGQIFLGQEEITALGPAERVQRGLARTFQINTLFPRLSALEAVTLAICQRRGCAGIWWRKLPFYGEAIEEAHAILLSLGLGGSCYRPTRELAYGQQRLVEIVLALASKPAVLLLDEPAAGVARAESAELLSAIASLSEAVSVLFIEHDMDIVFRFASRVIVMVAGRILIEGTPREIATDKRVRDVYLGGAQRA
jgi:branched-chain amino acid transport system ATP-binding protein